VLILLIGSLVAVPAVSAGDFDGSRPLLISVTRVVECVPEGTCEVVPPESLDLADFLKVDFTQKTIRAANSDDESQSTAIERQEVVDGKLILQGAEDGYEKIRDGLGWTVAISQDTGRVVLTASGDQVAFVIFGASLPLQP
jgi:hypothetical protein